MKKATLITLLAACTISAEAQRIDFNITGKESQSLEDGYTNWSCGRQASAESTFADNLGNIVVSSAGVPVKVKLTGSSAPSIQLVETEWEGTTVDAVRIKDLPDAGEYGSYMVRDSDTEGTTKIDESDVGLKMAAAGTNTLKFYRGLSDGETQEA